MRILFHCDDDDDVIDVYLYLFIPLIHGVRVVDGGEATLLFWSIVGEGDCDVTKPIVGGGKRDAVFVSILDISFILWTIVGEGDGDEIQNPSLEGGERDVVLISILVIYFITVV